MGSRFFKWFNKQINRKTTSINSAYTPTTNGEFSISPQDHDSAEQKNPEINETMTESLDLPSRFNMDDSSHILSCTLVSERYCDGNVKSEIACNESDFKNSDFHVTNISSPSSLDCEVLETTEYINTKLETSHQMNVDNCDVSINHISGERESSITVDSSALICVKPDILRVDHSVYSGLTADEVALIENEVEIQLSRQCPATYYDFCLITCDVDYEEATTFREQFCNEFNLTGCMLFDLDISTLGEDIFDQYESMMKRSTKIFFYHTDNYKKDNVHLRVQNGAVFQQLWERMHKDRDKCVPVFPNGCHKLGLALSGVSGLDPTLPDNLRRRVLATFTNKIRKVRVLKEAEAKRRRPLLYRDLVVSMVQCFLERKTSLRRQYQDSGINTQLALDDDMHRPKHELEAPPFVSTEISTHLQQMLMSLSVEEEAQNKIQKLVSESCVNSFANSAHSSEISVSDSSNVHIGPHIEVKVYVNSTRKGDSCHNSDSENDD